MPSFRFLILSVFGLVSVAQASLFPSKFSLANVEEMPSVASRLLTEDVATATDEWFHRRMTMTATATRDLAEDCDEDTIGTCAFVSIFDDDVDVYGSCGGLASEKDNAWCFSDDLNSDVCCGDADDCCDLKVGLVVIILVVVVAAIIASICGCCYCCKCCCLYDKFRGNSSAGDNKNSTNNAPPTLAVAEAEPMK